MQTYYVMPKDELGHRQVIKTGKPTCMTGVDTVLLPYGDYIKIKRNNGVSKDYPAYKVALAIAAGQCTHDMIVN